MEAPYYICGLVMVHTICHSWIVREEIKFTVIVAHTHHGGTVESTTIATGESTCAVHTIALAETAER